MKFRTFLEFFADLAWGKTLIRNYNTLPDIIVPDEGSIRRCINTVARKHFRAEWFHLFNVIRINHRNLAAPSCSGFVGISRQVIHRAVILLQRSINSDMMIFRNRGKP